MLGIAFCYGLSHFSVQEYLKIERLFGHKSSVFLILVWVPLDFAPWSDPGGPRDANGHAQSTPKAIHRIHFCPKDANGYAQSTPNAVHRSHFCSTWLPYTSPGHPKADSWRSSLDRMAQMWRSNVIFVDLHWFVDRFSSCSDVAFEYHIRWYFRWSSLVCWSFFVVTVFRRHVFYCMNTMVCVQSPLVETSIFLIERPQIRTSFFTLVQIEFNWKKNVFSALLFASMVYRIFGPRIP